MSIEEGENSLELWASDTIREINQRAVAENCDCQQVLDELIAIEKFLADFGFLTIGRDNIFCRKWSFSLQSIITSVELTMGSIVSCCKSACLADANSLLRKLRDDMFFYLYISVFDANKKHNNTANEIVAMEDNIAKWAKNGLVNFNIGLVLKAIGSAPQLSEIIEKYNLRKSFKHIGDRLNNYMHSNGYAYYNRNVNAYKPKVLESELKELLNDARYIATVFLILLILCKPLSVMSTDYIDYLDCSMTPPDDSQYWVAPFIKQYLEANVDLIDESCYQFLREQTMMQL